MKRSKAITLAAAVSAILTPMIIAQSQSSGTNKAEKKYQAKPPQTQPFGAEAFQVSAGTTIRWTGNGGFLINSRGTTLMVDPLLEGFDMPLLIDFPIKPKDVPHLDAVLVTHSDNDHYSVPTCRDLSSVCRVYHSTAYVASLMKKEGLPAVGHGIGEVFTVGPIRIKPTSADHAWQNSFPRPGQRHFNAEDACGFWIETPDGTIWATGDSRLMPQQLQMPQMDVILFDYSEDSQFHFGLDGSAKLANAYPHTPLLLGHWGTVDAPDFTPFNGEPKKLIALVQNPERVRVLAPGQPYTLTRLPRSSQSGRAKTKS